MMNSDAQEGPGLERLRGVWSQVLGRDSVAADDNFFSLGGDSITAIRLVAEARSAGLDISVEEVFLHPTLGELAREAAGVPDAPMTQEPSAGATLTTTLADLDPGDVPAGVADAYPLSSLQLGILYHCEVSDDPRLYHDLTSVRVSGPWDEGALRDAVAALVDRHDMLRTSFELAEFREPLQLVHTTATVPMETQDLSGLTDEEQLSALDDWWQRQSGTSFDETKAPLLRIHVGILAPDSFHLSLSVHHILLDGWSFARLATEVLVEYERRLGYEGPGLEPMPRVRYRDFVAAEQSATRDAASRTYWTQLLKGMEALSLPKPSAADGTGTGELVQELPDALAVGVQRFSAELGVPVKSVFLAAHLWAMGELCGTEDVVSGLCGNGRPESEGADLVLGVFLNVLPVRLRLEHGGWTELVRAAFDAEREHLPHRQYPLARMRKDLGHSPFEAMFNYTDFHVFDRVDSLRRISADRWSFADRTNFPVLVEVNRLPQRMSYELNIRVDPAEASATLAPRIGELMVRALTAIVREGDRRDCGSESVTSGKRG
ncbi:condensation domain-containing protein [Streptomyces sp. NPDC029674]|uniref:condensation domain-containing protein n=1 Tax=Streptomyces sp. NPDC029674 TaxID=3365297 RepID=UPI00384B5DEE